MFIHSGGITASGNSKERKVSLGGIASGKIPFVTIIINDEAILKKAKEVDITFTDGITEKEKISSRGTIVLHQNKINKAPVSYISIIIYDKDMIKLYGE